MEKGANAIPRWLEAGEPDRNVVVNMRGRVLDRIVRATLSFFEDTLFNETVSSRKGFLQKVEPRIKLAALFVLVVALSFERGPADMLPYMGFALLMAVLSRIPMGVYFKRLLPGVLLTAFIALPASLNVVVDGDALRRLFSLPGEGRVFGLQLPKDIFMSRQGAMSALGLLARASSSLMLVYLAGFTTSPARLVKSLGAMLPGFLRTLVAVSYRYMFFLVRRIEEFAMAQRARGAGAGFSGRRWVGSRAASIVLIALNLKDELGMAMEARGMGYSPREDAGSISFGANEVLFLGAAAGVLLI
jgi:cobalt/nickel transport system permease protein